MVLSFDASRALNARQTISSYAFSMIFVAFNGSCSYISISLISNIYRQRARAHTTIQRLLQQVNNSKRNKYGIGVKRANDFYMDSFECVLSLSIYLSRPPFAHTYKHTVLMIIGAAFSLHTNAIQIGSI